MLVSGKMIPSLRELKKISKNFIKELDLSKLKDPESSLSYLAQEFIKNQEELVDSTKKIQVFIVGGSVFEKAELVLRKGEPRLLNLEKSPITVFATKESFLDFISSHVDRDTELIGLNFAYPMISQLRDGLIDGKLVMASKGNDFKGLIGKFVGFELERYLLNTREQKVRVAVANDTVCLCLSDFNSKNEETVALIVGTGYNIALFERDNLIVNLEAGNFSGFNSSLANKIIDKYSNSIGYYKSEKEISGKYLYRHYNIYLSATEKLFNTIESAKVLSWIASGEEDYDFEEVSLARGLLERSASLVASHIAGIVSYKGLKNLNLIVEGSLFWKGYKYKDNFEKHFKSLIEETELIDYNIKAIDHSGLLGAGKLVVSHCNLN